jgi:hypothetical protein
MAERAEHGLAMRRLQHVADHLRAAKLVDNDLAALFAAEALLDSLDEFDRIAVEVGKMTDEFFREP